MTRSCHVALATFVLALAAACGGSQRPQRGEANENLGAHADAGIARAPAATPSSARAPAPAETANEESPLPGGWVTRDSAGNLDEVGREGALAVVRKYPLRVLVQVVSVVEECAGAGGTHVFFTPAYTDGMPFTIAHLGGHGVRIPHEKDNLAPGAPLYVAAVETHPAATFGNGRGWCLEKASPYDADVAALVPVRSPAEGKRLLSTLAH